MLCIIINHFICLDIHDVQQVFENKTTLAFKQEQILEVEYFLYFINMDDIIH